MSPFVRRASIRHTDRVLARSALFLLFAIFLATTPGRLVSERARLEFASSEAILARSQKGLPESHQADELPLLPGIGSTLVAIPFVLVGRLLSSVAAEVEERHHASQSEEQPFFSQMAFGLAGGLFTALCGWLIVLASRRLGASRGAAFLGALGYGLACHAWANSRDGLATALATFGVLSAFHLMLRVREELDRLRVPPLTELLSIGGALGLALLTQASLAPACLFFAVAAQRILGRGWRRQAASRWVPKASSGGRPGLASLCLWTPVSTAIALMIWLHLQRDGSPLAADWPWPLRPVREFPGHAIALLISPAEGLLWYAPWIVVVPWARSAFRGRRDWFGVTIALVVFAVCMLRGVAIVEPASSPSFGPRALLPAMPFLAMGFALTLANAESRGRRVLTFSLLATGILIQLPGALIDARTHGTLASQVVEHGPVVDVRGPGSAEVTRLEERSTDWRAETRWSWRFADPWAHWRILRNRVAVGGEDVAASEIFFGVRESRIRPPGVGPWGFEHIAWVDLDRRLAVSPWWGGLLAGLFFTVGVIFALIGLDSSAT